MFTSVVHFARAGTGLMLQSTVRLIVLSLLSISIVSGYSVLTHEAIVDSLWDTSIQKMY